MLKVKGKTIILRPIEIKILKDSEDDLKDFAALGKSAFDFWDNPEDDIYDEYYKSRET
ncbi:MAG: hypothetical protein WC843_05255 [Candidatus Gracilibacteria bacterium]|jgi:hypothetical protein